MMLSNDEPTTRETAQRLVREYSKYPYRKGDRIRIVAKNFRQLPEDSISTVDSIYWNGLYRGPMVTTFSPQNCGYGALLRDIEPYPLLEVPE